MDYVGGAQGIFAQAEEASLPKPNIGELPGRARFTAGRVMRCH